MKMHQKGFKIAILVMLLSPIIIAMLWIGSASWSNSNPSMGENVAKVDWLPDAASNVSFYKSYSSTAYEFEIPEEDFVALGQEKKWKLLEIEGNALRVFTYRSIGKMREKYTDPAPEFATEEHIAEYRRQQEIIEPTVTNGLVYQVSGQNGGGITVVYDRTKKRAYVSASPR